MTRAASRSLCALGVAALILYGWAPLRAQGASVDAASPGDPAPSIDVPSVPPSILSTTMDAVAASTPFDQVVQQPAGPAPTPRHTGVKALMKDLWSDVKHLDSKENLLWLGVGSGLALAAHPFDDDVNQALVGDHFAETFFKPGAVLGQLPTLLTAAISTYAVGRIGDHPRVSHTGMDLLQALIISEALTQPVKTLTNRERPDMSDNRSFFSGHAADTFAFATALERHLGWKGAVPAYIFSSYVAISRVPANRHWLSDAIFGASVGIIAGRTVTRHGREYPVVVAPVAGGVAVLYSPIGQRALSQ